MMVADRVMMVADRVAIGGTRTWRRVVRRQCVEVLGAILSGGERA